MNKEVAPIAFREKKYASVKLIYFDLGSLISPARVYSKHL